MIGLMCLKELMWTNQSFAWVYFLSLLVLSWDKLWISPELCEGCHDLMQKAMSFTNVAIVSIKGNDYRIHFWYMSKDQAINLFKKCWFDWKKWNILKIMDKNIGAFGYTGIEKHKFHCFNCDRWWCRYY